MDTAYGSFPINHAGRARHSNDLGLLLNRLCRSPSSKGLLKPLAATALILAFIFVFSDRCFSSELRTFKRRIIRLTSSDSFAKRLPLSYTPPLRLRDSLGVGRPGSYPITAYHFSDTSRAEWSQFIRQPPGDFVLEKFVETLDSSGGFYCRVRLIISIIGGTYSVQAGYNISAVSGVDKPVDPDTISSVSAITIREVYSWTFELMRISRDVLAEFDCSADLIVVVMAIRQSVNVASNCPSTDDPLCHDLRTVGKCEGPAPPPSPSPIPKDSCEVAFDECEFTFNGTSSLSTYSIDGPSDQSFTSVIVSKDPDVQLGVLNSNNVVPEFIEDSGAFPITDFGSQRFAPSQFKPYYMWQDQGSGIGHQTFHGNQEELSRNKCIRIFFTDIQLLNPASNLNQVPKSANKCVVFRTA